MSASFRNTPPITLLSATVSTATPVNSTALDMTANMMAAIQVTWTSTLSATFTLQGSLDNVSWGSTGVTITAAAGTAGTSICNVSETAYQYLRVQVVQSASSGVVTILGCKKCI